MTEDEIHNGIFGHAAPNNHCLCYIREITDLHDNIPEAIACRYVDCDPSNPTKVDEDAQHLLQKLKQETLAIAFNQSNIHKFSIPWSSGGVDHNVNEHRKYLDGLCKQVYSDVKRLVDKALVTKESKITELHREILHHASFCLSKCESFCGREELLSQIHKFLASENHKPLIIYGPSGSGKTTIMAKSMSMAGDWMGQGCVSVVRFLGTSPASSSIREVLTSVCSQVCIVYDMQTPHFSEMDTTQIMQFFCYQFLESLQPHVCGNNHLCIFLDSVDQLSPMDGAHSLHWLPKSLPSNVHFVISMLPEKHDCLKTIRTVLTFEDCYIEVGVLPLHTGLEIMDMWLTKVNRSITMKQRELVSKSFLLNPQPLYLRLLFHHTQNWSSYTNTSEINVSISTSEAIQQFFTNLEEQYGRTLVQRALGCITAAKSGLTESELEDVLSLDNDVLNEVYQYWDPPDKGLLRIPALLWKRIRYEISDYLVEQHADGKTVFAWYHRQFVESARAIYLKDERTRLSTHQALSDFFEGTWSGKECKSIILVHRNLTLDNASRHVAPQPIQFSKEVYNVRKLNELPYHLLLSKQLEKLKTIALCNFHWLLTKITVTSFQTVMQDFNLSIPDADDSDISITGETLSLSTSNLMSDPDSLAGQLLGRLISFKAKSTHIHTLTEQAHDWAVNLSGKHQLTPQNSCLISPGGPLKTTLSAHPHLIHALSVSSGNLLMVSSSKGTKCSIFNIWDVHYLPQYVQNLHTLKITDSGMPYFSLGNELLFGASGQTITAWNCVTGEKVFTFQTSHNVTSLTITHSSQHLLVGMADGSILCYDRSSGSNVESKVHNSSIDYIDAFQDGKIVTASKCGQLGIYDLNLHKHLHTVQAHSGAVVCATALSNPSKSNYVLTGSDDKTAKVCTTARGNLQLLHTLAGHTMTVRCIAHVHTNTNLAITGSLDKTIRIWDALISGTCLRTLEGHLDGIWCLATLPEGQRVVSGSKDDYLKVWDISTGDCLHTLEGHSSWVSCVATPSTDNVIVSGSNDKNIKIWKLGGARSPPTDRHFAQPECIVSTPNGLVVSGAPDTIKVWEVSSARCIHTFSSPASCLCTTDDGKYLISGSKDSKISIWNLTSLSRVRAFDSPCGATTCLATVDKNTYLSAHANGLLAMRNLYTDNYKTMTGHTLSIKCMVTSKDRCIYNIAASGSYDCTIRVWNISTTDCSCVAVLTGHTNVVWCVAISSDNSLLASGGDDSTVRIWSISESYCLHHITCPANVKCIAFSLDDEVVIAGAHCSQNQLKAWNTVTGECVSNYKGHTHAVMCIQIMDGHTVVTGSRDGTIKVWKITTGEMFATFDLQSQVKHIAISRSAAKSHVSLGATTKSGPIAILNYCHP